MEIYENEWISYPSGPCLYSIVMSPRDGEEQGGGIREPKRPLEILAPEWFSLSYLIYSLIMKNKN